MRRYFRAYPAISSRQQGADRLVYNETDLRTVLWQAVDPAFEGERPSTIRLAADIYLTKPIELGAYQYNVSIEGGGKFAIAEGSTFVGTYLFGLPSGSISDVDFIGVTFDLATITTLFGGLKSTAVNDFNIHECNLILAAPTVMFDSTVVMTSSTIDFDEYPPAHSFLVGTSSFTGTLTVGEVLTQYRDSETVFSRNPTGVLCGDGASEHSLRVDGAVVLERAFETLSGADPLLQVGTTSYVDNRSMFFIALNGTSGTLQIAPPRNPRNGYIISLYFYSLTGANTVKIDDVTSPISGGSYIQINKNHAGHQPNLHFSITMLFQQIAGASFPTWVEMARSENT